MSPVEITPIRRLAIANRGEISRRIARTCREMGVESVALYSDADANAPFVSEADIAVRIGPAEAARSYLSIAAVIDGAKRAGATAIHPGYGFLAENGDFAEAVIHAGLTWIGPSPDVIRTLGSKIRAKEIAAKAGVPNIPSFDPSKPEAMEFPVLLKASAGGGGKGMSVVESIADYGEALESARRIAASAFGDDAVMAEKLIERPRTSRSRSSAIATAGSSRWASASARSNGATRRSSRSRRLRRSTRACASVFARRRSAWLRRSATSRPAPSR